MKRRFEMWRVEPPTDEMYGLHEVDLPLTKAEIASWFKKWGTFVTEFRVTGRGNTRMVTLLYDGKPERFVIKEEAG